MLWKSFIWTAFHGDRKCEYQTLRRWHTTENCAMKSALSLHAYIKRGWDISKLTKNGRECEIFYKNWGTGDFLKRELNDFLSFWIFQIGDFFLNKILDIKNRSWKGGEREGGGRVNKTSKGGSNFPAMEPVWASNNGHILNIELR